MISPHTPPGTKVECIETPNGPSGCFCPVKKGDIVTVHSIEMHEWFLKGFCLFLDEAKGAFCLSIFRRDTDISGLVEIARGVDIKAPAREKIDA